MRKLLIAACLALFVLTPGALQAQIGVGGQLSYGDDVNAGIGVRGTFGLTTRIPLQIIGSFDYFFPGDIGGSDITYWELNGNLVYLFSIPTLPTVTPYAGAGLNLAYVSSQVDIFGLAPTTFSSTELGLNLLGGAQFNLGPVTPFGELRIELGGGEQFVITGGALFTVGPGF